MDAVHETFVGRAGAPSAVTWTVAETIEPVRATAGVVTATFGVTVGTTT